MNNERALNPTQQPRRLGRRCVRYGILLLFVGAVLAGAALWVVTRSWFIVGQITPELERRLGGLVVIEQAAYEGNGTFLIRGLTLRTPGLHGAAGEIASIGRAIVRLDVGDLWSGHITLREIELQDVLLRLSEDAHDSGTFAFMSLDPDWSDDDDDDRSPPLSIAIRNGILEYGIYDGSAYQVHGRRRVAGILHPAADSEHWYNFQLSETDEAGIGLENGLLMNGRWNAATHQHSSRIEGLELDDRTYNMCPQVVRLWWERMDLEGRLANATMRWSSEEGLRVAFDIADVGLTLPLEIGDWARYHDGRIVGMSGRQRMRVNSGSIVLQNDQLLLDRLVGELKSPEPGDTLANVPYTISVSLPQLPVLDWQQREQWMEDVVAHAPFTMTCRLQDFRVVPDEHGRLPAVDLPLRVAETLEQFQITDWTLSTDITVSRDGREGALQQGSRPQPIRSSGRLYIKDASGSYEKFPYPLTNVDAYLTFDQDHIAVEYVTGRTSEGGSVRLTGQINSPGASAAVKLRLAGRDIPVDDRLRNAMPVALMAVFDGLMHEPSQTAYREAGLLDATTEGIEQLRQQRRDVLQQLAAMREAGRDADDQAAPDQARRMQRQLALERQAAQLQALIEAGPFDLGGRVDLHLNIDRPHGIGQQTQVSGEASIHALHAIVRQFPYPFTITGGTIKWQADGAQLVAPPGEEGLPVVTQGGGRGFISGAFRRERDSDDRLRVVPDIAVKIKNDSINDLLHAAIPVPEDEGDNAEAEPRASMFLKGVGLHGALNYTGAIRADNEGRIGYDFDVHVEQGVAQPTELLGEALGGAGLLWPSEWWWDNVSAHVRVSRDAVELVNLTGHRDDGSVSAAGIIDLRTEHSDASLDVRFNELTLGQYLIDLMPLESVAFARRLWERYEPSGSFNAHLRYHRRSGVSHPPKLVIEPVAATVRIGDATTSFRRAAGSLSLQSNIVTFEGLELDVQRGSATDGRLSLKGSYGAADEGGDLHVEGAWTEGRFESPLIAEALKIIGADDQAKRLEALRAAGEFDASFRYTSPQVDRLRDYSFEVQPKQIEAVVNDVRLNVDLDRASRVRFTPGRIVLQDVTGWNEDGRFAVSGTVRTDDLIEMSLDLSYAGSLVGKSVQSWLPTGMRQVLEQIEFADGGITRIDDAKLRMAQVYIDGQEHWRRDFRARMKTDGASLSAGIDATDIDGALDLWLLSEPSERPRFSADVHINRMRLMGRELTDVFAPNVSLSDDGTMLLIDNVQATSYGGTVSAEAMIGVNGTLDYAATMNFVGVSLRELLADMADDSSERRHRGPRGELYGGVTISGLRGTNDARTGRGSVRAIGGSLANLPPVLQLMQLMQFNVPLRGDFDHADVDFFIDRDRMVFERILLESTVGDAAALQLHGTGQMDLGSYELNTQFRSRGGMLVIRDLVGGLSDQLYLIEVTGTLREPKARIIPLPGITHR